MHVVPNPIAVKHRKYTDSNSLLKRVARSHNRFYKSLGACLASEFDLEIAISNTLTGLPLTISQHYVASHQDTNKPDLLKLAWKACLNVVCDCLASRQLATCPLVTSIPHNPFCNAYLSCQREGLTGQLRKNLLEAASQPRMRTYLMDTYKWTDHTFDSIDWTATFSAIRGLSSTEHRFITKLIHSPLRGLVLAPAPGPYAHCLPNVRSPSQI
jgi:hypothetical protein